MPNTKPDVRITGLGASIVQFHLLTDAAKDFVEGEVQTEGWQIMGQALCVDTRFADGLRELMLEYGLDVEG